MSSGLAITIALALVLANAVFVAFEFALIRVRPTELEALVTRGRPGATSALMMRRKLDTWLATCQVGNTLCALALGWVGQPAFEGLAYTALVAVAPDFAGVEKVVQGAAVFLGFSTITFLHIIIGEQVPKILSISHAAATSRTLAMPMRVFRVVFFPLIAILDAGTRVVLRLLGLNATSDAHSDALGEAELRLIFASSAQAGSLKSGQAELLARALSMIDKTARQVMVPRSEMIVLDLNDTLEHNLQKALASGPTWLPVVRGSIDAVEGILSVKDVYHLHARGELKTLAQAQRPVFFVPEQATLQQLLTEFRRRNKQIAVVVDEHGGTSGLVNLTDVVAELIGDVAEWGRKSTQLRTLPGGRLEVPGTAQLDDLEHTLEVEFDVDKLKVTTVAGFLMAKLGRVPKVGDAWTLGDLRISVISADGPRVTGVSIVPRAPGASAEFPRAVASAPR